MNAIGAGTGGWKKALRLSCVLHLLVIFAVGGVAVNWEAAEPRQEQYIAVEWTAAQESSTEDASYAHPLAQSPSASGQTRAAAPEAQPLPATGMAAAKLRVSDDAPMASGGDGSVDAAGGAEVSGAAAIADGGADQSGASGPGGSSAADRAAAIDRFVSRVEAHKAYPYMALKRNQEGRPIVRVELDAAGDLIFAALSVPSGIQSLDNAAVKAVRDACPFRHGLGEALSMEVPVSYQLAGG